MRRALVVLLAVLLAGCVRRGIAGDVYATVDGEPLREPDAAPPRREGPHELSLEAATVLALESSPELAVRRLDPAIAGTFETIARGEFGVTLFADGQISAEQTQETNRATMMQFRAEGSRAEATAGIRQRTPTGTEIETSLGYRRDESNRSPEQQEARIGVTITQALLQGVDPEANLAAVRLAELETRATEHQLRAFVTALLLELETGYWQLALARESLAIHERSLALVAQQAEAMAARIEVGDAAPADALVVRAQVAIRRQALIDARAALEEQRLRLGRLLNLDPEASSLEVTDAIGIEPRAVEDPAAHHALAQRLRADLAEARVRLEQRRLDTVVTGNGVLPRLDLFVQLTKTGFGSSFGDAIQGLTEPTYEVTAGLRFEQLLGNDRAAASDRQAAFRRERAERAVGNLASLVRLDVDLALNEITRAHAQIDASRRTAELMQEVVEAERARLEVGETTELVLAQAERDLVEAQVAEVAALVAYRVALVRLWASEGSLLQRRAVRLGAGE